MADNDKQEDGATAGNGSKSASSPNKPDNEKRELSPESKSKISSPKRGKVENNDSNGKSDHPHGGPYKSLMERTKDTEKAEKVAYHDLLQDPKHFIHEYFFVSMPADFFSFWEFCKANHKNDKGAEKLFEPFGLHLVGPFDVLSGKFDTLPPFKPSEYLSHWRFYYDVPEFQTVLVKEKSEIHYGYWRDDLEHEQDHYLLARNDSSKGCEMKMCAANIFQAVLYYLEHDFVPTPFKGQVTKMKKSLEEWATGKGFSLTNAEDLIKEREEKIVCRTFHRAGLSVPYNRKTKLGYRPLQVSDAALKEILGTFKDIKAGDKEELAKHMEALQPSVTAAYIAVDESDFGTALELGIDIFCSGAEALHDLATQLLVTGYMQINRPKNIAIVKAHLKNRKKGNKLDLTSN